METGFAGNHRHAGYERRKHAQGLMLWRAIGLGLAIPALVYARTRGGDVRYIQRS
jgi:hypothetical protein